MFDAAFFTTNRHHLYQKLKPHSLLVLTANGAMQRSPDGAYMFEQEANFWYLTGIDYADWRLLVDVDTGQEWLIAPEVGEVNQIFDGSLAPDDAMQQSGISQVLSKRAGVALLRQLLASKKQAYTLLPPPRRAYGFYTNRAQYDLVRQMSAATLQDARLPLAQLRGIKQPVEISAIQKAVDVTVDGITAMLQELPQLKHEYEVEARLSYEFRRRGARGHAYDPIVAAGQNACTLHYAANNGPLGKKQWLLFDVGARHDHYAADITRTVPLSSPTPRQVSLYQAVLRVRDMAITLCRPGQNVRDYVEQVDSAMQTELIQLGLIQEKTVLAMRRYFPHAVSHGLGIDVHDPLGRPEVFAENMVLTVEPGIYVPEENIGIRIEDDILISATGPVNLSAGLPAMLDKF